MKLRHNDKHAEQHECEATATSTRNGLAVVGVRLRSVESRAWGYSVRETTGAEILQEISADLTAQV
jgi:hypothetical protein